MISANGQCQRLDPNHRTSREQSWSDWYQIEKSFQDGRDLKAGIFHKPITVAWISFWNGQSMYLRRQILMQTRKHSQQPFWLATLISHTCGSILFIMIATALLFSWAVDLPDDRYLHVWWPPSFNSNSTNTWTLPVVPRSCLPTVCLWLWLSRVT